MNIQELSNVKRPEGLGTSAPGVCGHMPEAQCDRGDEGSSGVNHRCCYWCWCWVGVGLVLELL